MSIQQFKQILRGQARASLRALGDEYKRQASSAVCVALSNHPFARSARTIMVYMPLPEEVDVLSCARAWLGQGRNVCVPRICPDNTEMEAARATSFDDAEMTFDKHGVRVPRDAAAVAMDGIDLVVVPGLAFDSHGHRLGRSAGYYDRFLSHMPRTTRKIGVCFHSQVVDNVPVENHDVKMDVVVTDQMVFSPCET